jgi:hypothetical protein
VERQPTCDLAQLVPYSSWRRNQVERAHPGLFPRERRPVRTSARRKLGERALLPGLQAGPDVLRTIRPRGAASLSTTPPHPPHPPPRHRPLALGRALTTPEPPPNPSARKKEIPIPRSLRCIPISVVISPLVEHSGSVSWTVDPRETAPFLSRRRRRHGRGVAIRGVAVQGLSERGRAVITR